MLSESKGSRGVQAIILQFDEDFGNTMGWEDGCPQRVRSTAIPSDPQLLEHGVWWHIILERSPSTAEEIVTYLSACITVSNDSEQMARTFPSEFELEMVGQALLRARPDLPTYHNSASVTSSKFSLPTRDLSH